ncbi:triose-phosphate isomerase [Leucobacter chinensis]|uniref:triose-phosphate isomerase n=1 Tax=Leucobacter chinensis TaxID=2851010 RepID=UPI001C233FF2
MSLNTRTPLIAGNWKMNLDHLHAIANVQKLSWALEDVKHSYAETEVAVFPPFTDLRSVQTLLVADKMELKLGAQDLSQHDSGAYTGDISGQFLQKLEVSYVIVGHSERRAMHAETNEIVGQKAKAAVKHELVPIICVGETAEERETRAEAEVPREQLREALRALTAGSEIVVAYEPVWAIGSGQAASPADAQAVIGALRELIREEWGAEAAAQTRILYGGSVASANVAHFMAQPDIDGVLVGGASLDATEFSKIAQFRKHVIAG